MIELDAPTVGLQWATGGLLFGWVTTRHRLVGLGYGWLLRITYGLIALGAAGLGWRFGWVPARDLAAVGVAAAAAVAGWQSFRLRAAGVSGQRAVADARAARVAAMLGSTDQARTTTDASAGGPDAPGDASDAPGDALDRSPRSDAMSAEFDPRLDLVAPAIGLIGLVAAGVNAGDPAWLAVARTVVGAAFLGVVSDAMLLGHWYLVQPGLSRRPLTEMVRWTGALWLPEVALFLVPTGMVSVWTGAIDDGFAGLLGWFWAACVITTIGLVGATLAALRERQYAAVMAATGLLYLAILTGFGIDLVARATLAP